jgi:uncharacterized protein YlxP (DUF503 family)
MASPARNTTITTSSSERSSSFAAAGRDVTQVEAVLDTVERYVWSHPEVLVLETSRHWLELDLH